MNTKVDGNYSLKELELALRKQEADSYELTALGAAKGVAQNLAKFKELGLGDPQPPPLTLSTGRVPAGRTAFWSGEIFVAGKRTTASACR